MPTQQNKLPLPSVDELDMAFGSPQPPQFKGWGSYEESKQHLYNIFLKVDDVLCEDPACMPLYPGIYEMLEDLKCNDIELAIVTSRNLKPILRVMDTHQITPYFSSIRSAQDMIDQGYRGKPHPDKLNCVLREFDCPADKAIMVGDTHMDIQMAKNAGVFALGVLWGYHSEQTLKEYGADAIVAEADEVKDVVTSSKPKHRPVLSETRKKSSHLLTTG
jgi:HAD superfamily hydrolase (TIGR01549 family)